MLEERGPLDRVRAVGCGAIPQFIPAVETTVEGCLAEGGDDFTKTIQDAINHGAMLASSVGHRLSGRLG